MTRPSRTMADTRRRRASTGRMMDEIMELARSLPLTEYLTRWGPGLLRLGAVVG